MREPGRTPIPDLKRIISLDLLIKLFKSLHNKLLTKYLSNTNNISHYITIHIASVLSENINKKHSFRPRKHLLRPAQGRAAKRNISSRFRRRRSEYNHKTDERYSTGLKILQILYFSPVKYHGFVARA